MKPNALVLALISAATALPGTANAADDICSRLIIYAISQFCQMLPNGQNLCQPIGLARPDPSCNSPSANQVVQIPLGPPSIQAWPYAQFPALPSTFAPNAFVPNTFAPNAFVPNTFAPYSFPPNAFAPNQLAGNPYLTYLSGQSPNAILPTPATPAPVIPAPAIPAAPVIAAQAPVSEPPKAPVAPPVQTPAVVASVKPETIVEAPPIPAVSQPIDKLMPEAKPEAVHATKPEAKPESAATVAAEPVPPVEEAKPAEQNVAQVTVAAQPATPATPVQEAPATVPASPVEPEAAKQAEVARVEAEKARQDALAHFEFDSAELTPVGRAMLDDWLKQASTNDPILVTGHADRLGPEPYNEKLSMLRAESVKKYLIEKGKPAKRIEIQAKGEKFPLISCTGTPTDATIACLAPNRRAEIVFKPSVRKAARTATKLIKPKSSR